MRLTRYFISGYKNLVDCDVYPQDFHVITGCNGTGKSNMLEALAFLHLVVAGSEDDREQVFDGYGVNGSQWTPMSEENSIRPTFIIAGEVDHNGSIWEFEYKLILSTPGMENPYDLVEPLRIHSETFQAKEQGKPGQKTTILSRTKLGKCVAKNELEKRKTEEFSVLETMSAFSALKVRHARDFSRDFPIANYFLQGLGDARIISLNPKTLLLDNRSNPGRKKLGSRATKTYISSINLYGFLKIIEASPEHWRQYCYWAKRILRITNISLQEQALDSVDGENITNRNLLFTQDEKVLWPFELSNGSMIVVALLALLLSPNLNERILFIEEPEAYIHPKAIVDLVTLMQNVVDRGCAIICSTHSPVVLNSLNADQVTLLVFDQGHSARSHLVSEIKEATQALGRGRVSFGDLLQTDFNS